MKIGIDFGTTNSSVAWFNPQTRRVESILFDNRDARVPSLVYWDDDPAKRCFGYYAAMASNDAENDANLTNRMNFQRHLARSFKTDFARNSAIESLNMGVPISSGDVVKEYLSWLMKEIREKTNTPASEQISAILTYPTTVEWDNRGEGSPVYRLKRIAEEVGFVNVDMMREPEAAFREAKRRNIELGRGVLVFDLGGGTLDLVYYKQDVNGEFNRPFVSGRGTSGIAGDAFDDVVIGLLDEQVQHDSNDALNIVAVKRRARYAKEELSERDEISVAMTTDNAHYPRISARITRDVFELRARHTFEQIKNELARYVEGIREQNAPLDTVLLIGGSTNIPKIRNMVIEVTGANCIRPPDADFYVSLGAVDSHDTDEQLLNNVDSHQLPECISSKERSLSTEELLMRTIDGIIKLVQLHGKKVAYLEFASILLNELPEAAKQEQLEKIKKVKWEKSGKVLNNVEDNVEEGAFSKLADATGHFFEFIASLLEFVVAFVKQVFKWCNSS